MPVGATPEIVTVRQDDTHRLIPSKYGDESALEVLADSKQDLSDLYELDAATNERLHAQFKGLPGIQVHELVFGIPNAHIINAAFAHPNPAGSRFSDASRGAWYAACEFDTSISEVSFHLSNWLKEVQWEAADWEDPQEFKYIDFLADFRTDFHKVSRTGPFVDCLAADDYSASQELARRLLSLGSAGIVYPSVRREAVHLCIACFRPALVSNVRRGAFMTLTYIAPNALPSSTTSNS